MSNYTVSLGSPPTGHELPPLLREVGAFVAQQPHGSMGYFDALSAEAIPSAWNEAHAERLRASGFAFLQLPDGGLLALLRAGEDRPAAVVLLGSEGEARTIANSLEEFLVRWSKGDAGVDELDDEEGAGGRKALAAWLKAKKVGKPKVKGDFDFAAWLDGEAAVGAAPAAKSAAREVTPAMAELGPKLRALAAIVGQRADAPAVIDYVTKVLGKKVPTAKKGSDDYANVSVPKHGIELVFSHDVLAEAYPPIPKGTGTFVPYVSLAWISEKFSEQVLGVPWKATEDEVVKALGEPRLRAFASSLTPTVPFWTRDLGGGVVLDVSFRKWLRVEVSIQQAAALAREPDAATGVFLGWAATRGLLNDAHFAKHAELLGAVKARKATGSELIRAALPRGLWNTALSGNELRAFAYRWFHNIGDVGMRDDFTERFGANDDDEPALEEDTWAAVDRAGPVLQRRFAAWLG